MLMNCPECALQVSDKAYSCPHCGYPFKQNIPARQRTSKKRRLPNGFGQISEIKGRNLRKPFRAMVCIGKTDTGRPICKPLKPESYFKTYNDAYAALVAFNRSPYRLDENITLKELYERWSESFYKTVAHGTIIQYEAAWNFCKEVYDLPVIELRIHHIKACMKEATVEFRGKEIHAGDRRQLYIKTLLSKMLDYALEFEIVDKNIARSFKLDKEISKAINTVKKSHFTFTDAELGTLWEYSSVDRVDMILIECYSGWRPAELCNLKISDVDLENRTFTGGCKTDAGKNRTVPIHPAIMDFVKTRYVKAKELGSEYLFCFERAGQVQVPNYNNYKRSFNANIKRLELNPEHTPHDCRKQFVSMAKYYGVDEYAIKYLVGHAIKDITEDVYTDRDPEWLRTELEKILV